MTNLRAKLAIVFLAALASYLSGVIRPSVPVRTLSADATRPNSEEPSGAAAGWLNVRSFGAQGDGLADDTTAIQKGIDEAKARKGSIVFFPSGIYLVSQIVLRGGISLIGSGINLPGNGLGTILQQKPGTDLDLIVSDQPVHGYHHGSLISNMSLVGATGTKRSSAIRFAPATGEGMKFEHLLIKDFAVDGIQVAGGVPFYAEDIHLFRNGIASGHGYGLDIASSGGTPSQTYLFSMISGDNNKTALIHIGPAGGIGKHQSYLFQGVKAEKHLPGTQNDVIVVDTLNGAPVTILGVAAVNNSGEAANSVVKVVGSNARLFWFGLNPDNALPNGYAHTIDDQFNRRRYSDSAGSAGTYAGSYYFDELSTASPSSHVGQAQANGDLAGRISVDGRASESHKFSTPFGSTPVCTVAPTSDPGKTTWWVTTVPSSVTVNLSTPARITFAYNCFGNPN